MRIRSALLAALLAGAPLAAAPQWTALGPDGGTVYALTVDPVDARVLYATANDQGTFKSVDGGATWRLIHTGITSGNVAVDPFRHTTIYQTLDFKQVLKSTDGGTTWSASSRGLPNAVLLTALAVDPVKRDRLYVAADGVAGGVWHSLDGGVSWKPARRRPLSGEARFVKALAVPRRSAGTVYAATAAGVFKSFNGGESWQPASRGLPAGAVWALVLSSAQPQVLWASVIGAGVFRSTNGGASWRPTAALPDDVMTLAIATGNPSQAWAGTWRRGAFHTTDGGAHWTAVGIRAYTEVRALAASGSSLYAGVAPVLRDPGGVLASSDQGATWQPRSTGITALETFDLAIDPHHPEILWAAAGASGLYRSTVGGRVWDFFTQPPFPTASFVVHAAFPVDGAVLYAEANGSLWASDDAGVSWRLALGPETTPATLVSFLLTHPLDAATLYAGAAGPRRLFTSRDSGATWQALEPGFDFSFNTLAVAPSAPATLYAAGNMDCQIIRAALFRSTDGGATWTKADSGLAGEVVLSLAVDPLDPRILYATSSDLFYNPTAVSKSTDGGATWSGLGPPVVGNLVFSAGGGTLWGNQGSQVFASRDGGASWQSVGGPQVYRVDRLIPDPADPDRLYAATSGGIWALEDRP